MMTNRPAEARLDRATAWSAIRAAEGSVRLAASTLGVTPRALLGVLVEDPSAVITARRTPSNAYDSGPLQVFELTFDDDEEDPA